ncbi:MAG: DJ-1/PfpI family protein [Pseudomonadales bacterium]
MPQNPSSPAPLRIGGLLYPNFELLDLFGPLEMFSLLGTQRARIHMIAEQPGPVPAAMGGDGPLGPRVLAEHGFADAPALDVLLVPGGFGTFEQLENARMLEFLRARAADTAIVASVCTGSALLARAGLLDGLRATSNKQFFSLARAQSDKVHWVEQARWVDAGRCVTSSGVSAGTDMALALIARLLGEAAAEQVAVAAEYSWQRDADHDPFVSHLDELAGAMGGASG